MYVQLLQSRQVASIVGFFLTVLFACLVSGFSLVQFGSTGPKYLIKLGDPHLPTARCVM